MFYDGFDSTSLSGSTSMSEDNDSDFSVRKYKEAVKKFLKELITKHDPTVDSCDISDLELDIWEDSSNEGTPCAENSPLRKEDDVDRARPVALKRDEHKPIVKDKQPECITVPDDANLFMIDTRPTVKDGRDVPSYRQRRSFKMLVETEERKEVSTSDASPKRSLSCFNCKGNHNLRECPKPRNNSNIMRNRRDFSNAGKQAGRYHVDEEQKYAQFVPGKISDDLRRALGLRRNELPKHIYRMRLLGYPPGWLAAAKVRYSGISIFDEQGKEVLHSDDEEGELITEEMKVKYDPSKIISFPGFNVQPPSDTKDESKHYRCPPMMEEQSLEAMLGHLGPTYMGGKRHRKKAVQAVQPVTPRSDLDLTAADMEVEDVTSEASLHMLPSNDNCRFIPPLPIGTPPQLPPPPPSETPPRPPAPSSMESDSEGADTRSMGAPSPLSTRGCSLQDHSSISSPRAQSPSLSELESKKALLLAQLEDGASSDTCSTVTMPKSAATTPKSIGTTTLHTPVSLGKVKVVNFGTPVIQSSTPYKRLPEPLRFSKDISDVINFENLPESTGAYEKMSGVIQKVRKIMTQEQQKQQQ